MAAWPLQRRRRLSLSAFTIVPALLTRIHPVSHSLSIHSWPVWMTWIRLRLNNWIIAKDYNNRLNRIWIPPLIRLTVIVPLPAWPTSPVDPLLSKCQYSYTYITRVEWGRHLEKRLFSAHYSGTNRFPFAEPSIQAMSSGRRASWWKLTLCVCVGEEWWWKELEFLAKYIIRCQSPYLLCLFIHSFVPLIRPARKKGN